MLVGGTSIELLGTHVDIFVTDCDGLRRGGIAGAASVNHRSCLHCIHQRKDKRRMDAGVTFLRRYGRFHDFVCNFFQVVFEEVPCKWLSVCILQFGIGSRSIGSSVVRGLDIACRPRLRKRSNPFGNGVFASVFFLKQIAYLRLAFLREY